MVVFRGSGPGHSVEPTSKTWSVACLLFCLRAQFGRTNPNLNKYLENPFHLLTDRTLRTALFKRTFELRIQHVKQLGIVGKEWSVEIGRMQVERIPSRSERDRPLEIRFVEPGRLRAALQLDPFCRHKVPCAAATKFNERGKGGVC